MSFAQRTPEWDAQFRRAVEIAYRQLQLLAGPKYGISWIYNYSPTEQQESARGTNELLPDSVRTFPEPEMLAEMLDAAGLTEIRWLLLAGGIIAIHSATNPA